MSYKLKLNAYGKRNDDDMKKRQEIIVNQTVFEVKTLVSQKPGIVKDKIKVLFMFDEPLDCRDKAYDEMIIMQYMRDGLEAEVTWCDIPTALEHIEEVKSKIKNSDTVIFDYGGVSIGCGGIIDHWNNFFYKLIEDYSDKYWYCHSHVDTFDSDTQKDLEERGVVFLNSYNSKYKNSTVGFREIFMSEEGRKDAKVWLK